jgi:hypothetical protein
VSVAKALNKIPKPYRDHPSRYEQACLREVLRVLMDVPVDDPLVRLPVDLHEVRLDGEFPDTKVVIVASRGGDLAALEWEIWGNDFGVVRPDDSNRGSPLAVADQIMIDFYEHF